MTGRIAPPSELVALEFTRDAGGIYRPDGSVEYAIPRGPAAGVSLVWAPLAGIHVGRSCVASAPDAQGRVSLAEVFLSLAGVGVPAARPPRDTVMVTTARGLVTFAPGRAVFVYDAAQARRSRCEERARHMTIGADLFSIARAVWQDRSP